MKKLRLLFTPDCNRNCKKCCNKDWDLEKLPKVTSFYQYDEIIITGGEPLLYPERLIGFLQAVRLVSSAKIYLYTAITVRERTFKPIYDVIQHVDGVSITLHNQNDVNNLYHVVYSIKNDALTAKAFMNKSIRLNVFKGIDISIIDTFDWTIKYIEWKDDCPLPANEEFKRL